jgi:serine/threonine-protein kinase
MSDASSDDLSDGRTVKLERGEPGVGVSRASTTPVVGQTLADRATVLPRDSDAEEEPATGPRFETLRKLGEGGMGEVQLVTDQDIGRTVAVKRLLPSHRRSGEALMRFAREIRTVGRLEHPNIVPIHDVGVDSEGMHYFVMKYVEGETLESVIRRLRAGDPALVARFTHEHRTEIFMEILKAMEYAHAHGILHRDIKPANVIVGRYGEVMLMDWGIAKDRKRGEVEAASRRAEEVDGGDDEQRLYETQRGALVGTPAYMSPEQARGEVDRIDERSDTYSLCVLFHELLTLHHYLAGKRRLPEMLLAIGRDPEPPLTEWVVSMARAGVPAELNHFLRRGLRKDPAQRYASVREMIVILERIREHRMPVQCHFTLVRRGLGELNHVVNRHPWIATFALLVSAALMVAGAASLLARALLA